MRLIANFDGLCEPTNPGGIAVSAWQIQAAGEIIVSDARMVAQGKGATNNIAEYWALIDMLEYILSLPSRAFDADDSIDFLGDSKLVVEQVNGRWSCNAANLRPLCERSRALLAQFGVPVTLSWIPRAENHEADEIARRKYESLMGRSAPER